MLEVEETARVKDDGYLSVDAQFDSQWIVRDSGLPSLRRHLHTFAGPMYLTAERGKGGRGGDEMREGERGERGKERGRGRGREEKREREGDE